MREEGGPWPARAHGLASITSKSSALWHLGTRASHALAYANGGHLRPAGRAERVVARGAHRSPRARALSR